MLRKTWYGRWFVKRRVYNDMVQAYTAARERAEQWELTAGNAQVTIAELREKCSRVGISELENERERLKSKLEAINNWHKGQKP